MLNTRRGRPPLAPRMAAINITLSGSQLERLRRIAAQRPTYISVLIREAVEQSFPPLADDAGEARQ